LNTDDHEAAWSAYLEHQDVFAAVLRATGPWQINDGVDLVHDFLVERLPQALVSYDPQRGPIRPWLYTVFIRYAKRRLSEQVALRERLLSLESVGEVVTGQLDQGETLTAEQRQRVQDALRQLPDDLRAILLTYFGNGPEAGSIRTLARQFKWSRHRAGQTVLVALATLAAQLEEQGILTDEEFAVCRAHFVHGETWEEVAVRLRKTQHQIRTLLKRALHKFGIAREERLDASIHQVIGSHKTR